MPEQTPRPRGRSRELAPWRFRDLLLVAAAAVVLSTVFAVPTALFTFVCGELPETEISLSIWFGTISSAVYLALAVAVWLMIVERRGVPWRAIGVRRAKPSLLLAMLPAGVGLLILNLLLILPVTFFLGLGDEEDASRQDAVFEPEGGLTAIELFWLAVPLVILAPIVEELLFRGLLYRYLRGRTGVIAGVIVSAIIFAVLHAIIPPLFVMGIVLAILAERTDSLLPGIVLHATNNALVVLAIWLAATTT